MPDAGEPVSSPVDDRPARPRRRRLRLVLAAVVAVALVAAVAGFVALRSDGSKYPDEWDPRVRSYVEVVEEERGLTFEHPVRVRFLDDAAFEKSVRADAKDLDPDERQEIEETTSVFRALGLIGGDVDLFEAFNDATGSGTLAYYAFDTETITVRGTELTLASRGTLVHELTHALQDQRFGVGDRIKRLGKQAADGRPTTEVDALRAIVEGDAERVADLYRASLDTKDRTALEKAEGADTEQALTDYEDLPQVVVALLGAPYALGQALTETITAKDTKVLDRLLKDPPPDDSVLLDPLKALDAIDDPADVEIPALGQGEKKVDSGQMGALVTYLMLAERIPLREALATADTWAGDAFVAFTRDGVVCARVDYTATTGDAARQLVSAFDDWIAAAPGTQASVERDGDRVTFESCDPGEDAAKTREASQDALQLVATRASVSSTLVASGAPAPLARCFGRRIVDEYSVADLTDPAFGADDPAVTARIQEIARDCA
jgi:hypothetical protein